MNRPPMARTYYAAVWRLIRLESLHGWYDRFIGGQRQEEKETHFRFIYYLYIIYEILLNFLHYFKALNPLKLPSELKKCT